MAVDDEGEVFGEGGGEEACGARGWWVGVGGCDGSSSSNNSGSSTGSSSRMSEVHDLVLTALPVADGDALAAARAGAEGGVVVVVRSVVRVRGGHDW